MYLLQNKINIVNREDQINISTAKLYMMRLKVKDKLIEKDISRNQPRLWSTRLKC